MVKMIWIWFISVLISILLAFGFAPRTWAQGSVQTFQRQLNKITKVSFKTWK